LVAEKERIAVSNYKVWAIEPRGNRRGEKRNERLT
jgi:hypothetical protein